MRFKRKALLEHLLQKERIAKADSEDLALFLRQAFGENRKQSRKHLLKLRRTVVASLQQRWKSSHRTKRVFEKTNRQWLEGEECLEDPTCGSPGRSRGRPALPFRAKGRRAKLLATADLRRSVSTPQLVFAAASAVHQEGRRQESKLLEVAGSPRRGSLLVSKASATPEPHGSYTEVEALALMTDLDLTTAQYNNMRQSAVERGCSLYPSYKRVTKVKSDCLPPTETITLLPDQAQVELQPLLDHTAARLLQLQEPVLEVLTEGGPIQLVLHCKWGMDGSSGHSQYKQAGVRQDDQMFVTTLVPLQLQTEHGTVVWRNATPSSTRFCRPIRLQQAKENKALTEQELQRVNSEISTLQPLRTEAAVVRYQLTMSMVSK